MRCVEENTKHTLSVGVTLSAKKLAQTAVYSFIVLRGRTRLGQHEESRPLGCSNTGSPRFTDFPSNLANLIGWEYETNTQRMLRKSGQARCHDSWCTQVKERDSGYEIAVYRHSTLYTL